MEVRAHIKYVKMSPLKLREIVDAVKVLSPQVALDRLQFSQRRNAKALRKALVSAIANGQGITGFDPKKAVFKTLKIDEGPFFKRFRPGSRGTAKPYVRKSSHITIVLEQKGLQEPKKVSKPVARVQKAGESEKAQTAQIQTSKVEQKVEEKPVIKKTTKK